MAVKISIRPNGPYLVEGEVELVDVNGNKVDTSARGPRFALCRCGASVTKPFCDGTQQDRLPGRRGGCRAGEKTGIGRPIPAGTAQTNKPEGATMRCGLSPSGEGRTPRRRNR